MKALVRGVVPGEVCELIRTSRRVLLVSRLGADGDDVGCLVALHRALERLGIQALAFCPEPVPPALKALPGVERLVSRLPEEPWDLLIALECASPGDLPEGVEPARSGLRVLNLDHHTENQGFGDVAWVDPDAAALGEMVFDLVEALGVTLDSILATALYVAIFSDTNSFQFPRVDRETHLRVARLLEFPIATDRWGRRLLREEPLPVLKLFGRVLSRLRLELGGRLAWSEILAEDLRELGLSVHEVRHLIERMDQVRGCELVALLVESPAQGVKVSLRSRVRPVHQLAARLGGGGHELSAGFHLSAPLTEARAEVLVHLKRLLVG